MTVQAPRLDIITENVGENIRRVQARDLAATVVQAIFRLVKQSTLHSLDNQAVVRQVEDATQVIVDYGQRSDQNVSILFAFGSIFVGGSLLKANRQVYEGAVELGEILKKYGFAELAIARNVSSQDLFAFVSAFADAHRNNRSANLEKPSGKIRLRGVTDAALKRGAVVERLDETQAVVRMYSSAIVIMRRFFEQLQRGRYELPQRVKRIAQMLVDLSRGETPAFLGVTAARNANQDEAGRAVNTAILAVSMARQITDDIVVLSRIAMAALLFDTARSRLTGTVGPKAPAIIPRLSDAQELEVPAATAAVLTALGHVNEPAVMRTVLTYEAHWVRRVRQLGPVYRGARPATLQSRVVSMARRFNDLLTPAPGEEAISADQAIATLEAEATDPADHTVVRLLIAALGIFPTGTLVQLGSNEMGLVVTTPPHPSMYSQPRVRIMFDAGGRHMSAPVDVDLSALKGQDPRKQITRIVSPADDASRAQARAGMAKTGEHASGLSNPSAVSQLSVPSAFTPSGVSGVGASRSPAPTQQPRANSGQQLHQNAQPQAQQHQHAQPQAQQQPQYASAADQAAAEAYAEQQRIYEQQKAAYEIQKAAYDRQQAAYAQQQAYEQQQQAYEAQQAAYAQQLQQGSRPPATGGEDGEGDAATRAVSWGQSVPAPAAGSVVPAAAPSPGHTPSPKPPLSQFTPPPGKAPPAVDSKPARALAGLLANAAANRPDPAAKKEKTPAPGRVRTRSAEIALTPSQPPPAPAAPEPDAPLPQPTAEGTLVKTPLVHLFVYMLDQRLTGTANFHTPEGAVHSIYFEKGVPSKVKTWGMVAPLDRVLMEMGVLDEVALRHSLMEVVKKKMLHGRYLVSKGLVDGTTIMKALSKQMVHKLLFLFELAPETKYLFYADVNLLANYAGPELTPCEPLAIIMTGVRMRGEDPLVDQTLSRLAKRQIGLHLDAEMKRFELRKEEASVADLLRLKKMSFDDMLAAGVAPERIVRLTLYTLAITRHLDIAGLQGRPPVGVTMRDRVRRSGVVEPGPVAIRDAGDGEAAGSSDGDTATELDAADVEAAPAAAPLPPPPARVVAPPAAVLEPHESPAPPPLAPPPLQPPPPPMQSQPSAQAPPMQPPPKPPPSQPHAPAPPVHAQQYAPPVIRQPSAEETAGTLVMGPDAAAHALAQAQGPGGYPGAAQGYAPPPGYPPAPQAHASGYPPAVFPAPAGGGYPPAPTGSSPGFPAAGYPPAPGPHNVDPQQYQAQLQAQQYQAQQQQAQQQQQQYQQQQYQQQQAQLQAQQYQAQQQALLQAQQAELQAQRLAEQQQQAQQAQLQAQYQQQMQAQQAQQYQQQMQAQQAQQYQQQMQAQQAQQYQQQMQGQQAQHFQQPPHGASEFPAGGQQQSKPPGGFPGAAPAAKQSSPGGAPPTHLSQDHRHRWQEIMLRVGRAEKETHYELLDVDRNATEPQIQAAYFKLAKSWHPDRLPAELQELKTIVSTIFAKFNEAYNTLNDQGKRVAYNSSLNDASLAAGVDQEAEQVQRVVDAALEFQKAEVMLKKNDLAGAEGYARSAAQADPEQVEYLALLTWIQAMKRGDPPIVPEGKTSTFYDDLLQVFDGILAKEAMFERALYYRAVLLKRAGKEEKAMRDFRLVVQLNPKNIDAIREVRINQMRRDKKRKDDAGILGKLFKK